MNYRERQLLINRRQKESDDLRPRVHRCIESLSVDLGYDRDSGYGYGEFLRIAVEVSPRFPDAWKGSFKDSKRKRTPVVRRSLQHYLHGTPKKKTGKHTSSSNRAELRVWKETCDRVEMFGLKAPMYEQQELSFDAQEDPSE